MNKINFYDFLKQKYENFSSGEGCNSCPCKILRNKMLGSMRRGICLEEIIYLAKKYKIDNANVFLCEDCMLVSLEIAKKLFGKKEFNKI